LKNQYREAAVSADVVIIGISCLPQPTLVLVLPEHSYKLKK
jgi:hypothetical protein